MTRKMTRSTKTYAAGAIAVSVLILLLWIVGIWTHGYGPELGLTGFVLLVPNAFLWGVVAFRADMTYEGEY